MYTNNYLLNYLDAPTKIVFFTIDEFLMLLCPLIIGCIAGQSLLGMIIAIFGFRFLKQMKANNHVAMMQIVYWYFPLNKKALKLYVPSHIREYIA
jgi:conjugal transfer pilus assembly protein TraL